MIVVGHQHIGVDPHAKTLRKLPQSLQKIFVTTPIPKNHLSLMPSVDHMIPSVRYFQSGKSSHLPPSHPAVVMSNADSAEEPAFSARGLIHPRSSRFRQERCRKNQTWRVGPTSDCQQT